MEGGCEHTILSFPLFMSLIVLQSTISSKKWSRPFFTHLLYCTIPEMGRRHFFLLTYLGRFSCIQCVPISTVHTVKTIYYIAAQHVLKTLLYLHSTSMSRNDIIDRIPFRYSSSFTQGRLENGEIELFFSPQE